MFWVTLCEGIVYKYNQIGSSLQYATQVELEVFFFKFKSFGVLVALQCCEWTLKLPVYIELYYVVTQIICRQMPDFS